MGPGEPWERIPADPGMDFHLKIPAGKDPGNLGVHLCPALCNIFGPIKKFSSLINLKGPFYLSVQWREQ